MSVVGTSSEQSYDEAIRESYQEEPGDTEQAHLSAWDAVALLLGIQIGSGIFASPSRIDSNVPSPFTALFAWLFAGILAWTGATSFAELGCCFPVNGGMQEYLRHMYGDAAAAVMAWTWIVAIKPSSMAILSITLVESMGSVISPDQSLEYSTVAKLFAISAQVVILLLNCISPKTTTKITRIFAFFKLLAVGLVLLAGVVVVAIHILSPEVTHPSLSKDWYTRSWFAARPTRSDGKDIDWSSMDVWASLGHFSTAIYAGIWAFSGWDNANFVAREIRSPAKSLPFAVHTTMIVLILCYLCANAAYYVLLPWQTVGLSDSVAVTAALSLIGPAAAFIMASLISVSCAGAISGNLFVVSRLIVAAAKRGYLPHFLGVRGVPGYKLIQGKLIGIFASKQSQASQGPWIPLPNEETEEDPMLSGPSLTVGNQKPLEADLPLPINAMVFSTILTLLYILIGTFRTLLIYVGIAEFSFFCLTIVGLIRLRLNSDPIVRKEGLYEPWLVIPIIFCTIGSAVLLRSVLFNPLICLAFVGLVVGGILIYYFFVMDSSIKAENAE